LCGGLRGTREGQNRQTPGWGSGTEQKRYDPRGTLWTAVSYPTDRDFLMGPEKRRGGKWGGGVYERGERKREKGGGGGEGGEKGV